MGTLIDVIGSWTGLDKLVKAFDGFKSYLAGVILILSGSAGFLQELADLKDLGSWVAFLKFIPSDPSIHMVAAGLAILGLRHAIAKSTDASATASAITAPSPYTGVLPPAQAPASTRPQP